MRKFAFGVDIFTTRWYDSLVLNGENIMYMSNDNALNAHRPVNTSLLMHELCLRQPVCGLFYVQEVNHG